MPAERVDDGVDRGLGVEGELGVRQRNAVKAGLAMNMLGGDQAPRQGRVAAGVDGDGFPRQFRDLPRVPLGERQGHVPRDGGEGQHLQFRRGEGHQDGDRVVLAGVGVDDDLAGGHGELLSRTVAEAGEICPDGQENRAPRRTPPVADRSGP